MGQYHYVYNLDKKQYLHPRRFDDGATLLEFASASNRTMKALAILLAASNGGGNGNFSIIYTKSYPIYPGCWAGDRIAIIGDEPGDEAGFDLPYDWRDVFIDISGDVIEMFDSSNEPIGRG